MEIRTSPPMHILCYRQKTTLEEAMLKFVRVKAQELYAVTQKAGLEVCGPQSWVYYGADGNPKTEFTLEIAIPVTPAKKDVAPFEIRELPSFRYAGTVHRGSWAGLGETYGKLIGEILQAGYQLSGINREVYLHCDFENPDNNITEVQMGIGG